MNNFITCWFSDSFCLLAKQGEAGAAGDAGAAGEAAAGAAPTFVQQLMHPMNLVLFSLIMFFLLVVRPQKTEMKKLQSLLANLKKNDRVVTSGGIHAVVVQANAGEPTVVIRIDESSGAKMTINREAIVRVLNLETEPDKKS